MFFCPLCANLLLLTNKNDTTKWYCKTCFYTCPIEKKLVDEAEIVQKKVELSFGDTMKTLSTTEVNCPKCNHGKAYFFEMQTRGGDEPMSIFHECCSCSHHWRVG